MYCILVYDIKQKRLAKMLKLVKQYLNWVQNSTFEGEISPSTFRILLARIDKIINSDEDSVIIYKLQNDYYLTREELGIDKTMKTSNII